MRHCAVKSCGKPNDGTLNDANRVCVECLSIQIPCGCGCDNYRFKYDKQGTEYKYIMNHDKRGMHCVICGEGNYDSLNNSNRVCSVCLSIKILCQCGCGQLHFKYDKKGRERKYIKGHDKIGLCCRSCHKPNDGTLVYGKKFICDECLSIQIPCICGCGYLRSKYGKRGHECKYINGHDKMGKHRTPESIEKTRQGTIQARKDGKYSILPNKPEMGIYSHLQEVKPKEYKYTGDGSFWIEDLNPDFININGQKKCIEHFGDYWHDCPICYPNNKGMHKQYTAEERISKYRDLGWDCLVIWEHDVKNDNYKQLINDFILK